MSGKKLAARIAATASTLSASAAGAIAATSAGRPRGRFATARHPEDDRVPGAAMKTKTAQNTGMGGTEGAQASPTRSSAVGNAAAPPTRGASRQIPLIGTFIAALAVSAALALALTGTPGRAAAPAAHPSPVTAAYVKLTPAESASLHKLVSTERGREELFTAFADSYGRVGSVGTGPVVKPGTTELDLSWGLSGSGGEHFWIIASYADILGGALARMRPYCAAALTPFIDPVAAAAVCVGVVAVITKMAQGHKPLSDHGVWAEVHFWPFWTGAYPW